MIVSPLAEAHLPAWRALFEAAGSPCFCRYWHYTGDKNGWLDRCVNAPEANYEEHAALVRAGDPSARGLVALEDDRPDVAPCYLHGALTEGGACIGWMKLVPRATVPKLRNLSVYRPFDMGSDEGVLSVGCFLVHPEHRMHGVARALLEAAPEHARAWGARAIEVYPRRVTHALHPEEAWMGPSSLATALGYREVAGEGQYPVFRREI